MLFLPVTQAMRDPFHRVPESSKAFRDLFGLPSTYTTKGKIEKQSQRGQYDQYTRLHLLLQ